MRRQCLTTYFRRGQLFDIVFIVMTVFAFAVIYLVMSDALDKISPEIVSVVNATTPGIQTTDSFKSYADRQDTLWDRALLIVLFGLGAGAVISSFFVRQHPIFFWLMVLAMTIMILVNMILSNAYQDFADSDALATTSDKHPITYFVMEWFPVILLGLSVVIAVIAYGKPGA